MVPNSLSPHHYPSSLANAPGPREWPVVCIIDAPDNIEPLADALSKIGFRAFACLGGALPGALPAPRSFSAAIIADSVEDHLRLAAEMAALCPVLIIASDVTAASQIAAARVGVDGILQRPLDVNELAEWLNDLVGDRQRRPLSILIVDDDEALAETYAMALQNAGMRAVAATNPAAAFDQIAMAHIDLVLMDIQMPDVSGIELARAIRQSRRYRSLPIVFLSAERDPARRLEARQLGGDDFIAKPVQLSRLVSLVRMRATRASCAWRDRRSRCRSKAKFAPSHAATPTHRVMTIDTKAEQTCQPSALPSSQPTEEKPETSSRTTTPTIAMMVEMPLRITG